jgi:catechol 2,3-dioxygenase-like lactoylglutathione lyase family enzyme
MSDSVQGRAPEARYKLAHSGGEQREPEGWVSIQKEFEPRRGGTKRVASICVLLLVAALQSGAQQQAVQVLFPDLLANPRQFHDKTIEVRGFLLQEYENSALYSTDKWHYAQEAIWITPPPNLHLSRGEVNRHYAVVTGVFDANDHGHLGSYSGTLKVSKLILENTNNPAPEFQAQGAFWAIVVADIDASERWYLENLGLRRIKKGTAPNGKSETVVLGGHGIYAELVHYLQDKDPQAQAGPKDGQRLQLGICKTGLTVSPQDFDAILHHLRQRQAALVGRVISDDEMGMRAFIVRDNTGNLIQFFAKQADKN